MSCFFLKRRSCRGVRRRRFTLSLLCGVALALGASSNSDSGYASQPDAIRRWWEGSHLTGGWWSGRQFLESRGLNLVGDFSAVHHGVPIGDSREISIFCHCISLTARFDFGKMLGVEGLTGQAGVQWQTGKDINGKVGAGSAFSPAAFTGHWRWRLRPIDLTYVTPEVFGIKEFFTISGGWQNPKNYFMVQPDANVFQNCAFGGGGLAANDVAFDGAYIAWGGYTRIRPTSWSYVQAGFWGAVPEALNWRNRGVYFRLARPFRHNGVFVMGEMGVSPELGAASLPGKYVFGSYYWGLPNRSFLGATYPGRFGFYWQADQMLYREPAPLTEEYPLDAGLSQRDSARSQQGLFSFVCVSHAPKFNNVVPVFLRAGLVYKGLFPNRDRDDLGVAFAFGNYSYYSVLARRTQGRFLQRTSEAVWEVDYRFQANKWLRVQPFLEYLFRPSGSGHLKDALVLGVAAQLTF
ncbi:Porin B precursor [Candidatus Xiphinematobacter sp. Idaho Grape]|uniref:carbohydrate porin n=1 Tax=Candidatus Xiphinematobacter sp. Idaho Grape TaxID=1704307 RepID=UPI000706B1DA|nr:carbohydrate porin [Candidatus Xiphinematobacter sp. Idaho Grape]ALJ56443.1 Porin B precursor [Candidatus Xiphinematobacter sp. Idaho Grape]